MTFVHCPQHMMAKTVRVLQRCRGDAHGECSWLGARAGPGTSAPLGMGLSSWSLSAPSSALPAAKSFPAPARGPQGRQDLHVYVWGSPICPPPLRWETPPTPRGYAGLDKANPGEHAPTVLGAGGIPRGRPEGLSLATMGESWLDAVDASEYPGMEAELPLLSGANPWVARCWLEAPVSSNSSC